MSNPIIADNKPVIVSLSKGQEYYFCTCGKSKSQPFYDGSHVGTSFTPKVIVSDNDDDVAYLWTCKHTGNTPYCDRSEVFLSTTVVIAPFCFAPTMVSISQSPILLLSSTIVSLCDIDTLSLILP